MGRLQRPSCRCCAVTFPAVKSGTSEFAFVASPGTPCKRFNSVTVDIAKVQVEDTADFALKLFATVNQLRKDRKAGEMQV